MNVDFIDKNALFFIMDHIVDMATGVISTISLRFFRYWKGTFACEIYTSVLHFMIWAKSVDNWQFWKNTLTENCQRPALGKVIEPRSNMTYLYDSELETCFCQSEISIIIGSTVMTNDVFYVCADLGLDLSACQLKCASGIKAKCQQESYVSWNCVTTVIVWCYSLCYEI